MNKRQRMACLKRRELIRYRPNKWFVPGSLSTSNFVCKATKREQTDNRRNKHNSKHHMKHPRFDPCFAWLCDEPSKKNKRKFSGKQFNINGSVWMNNATVVTGPGVANSIYHKIANLIFTWEFMYRFDVSLTNVVFVNWLINGELRQQINPRLLNLSTNAVPDSYLHGLHIRLYKNRDEETLRELSKVVATIYNDKKPVPTFTVAGLNDDRQPQEYLNMLADLLEHPETYLLDE